MRITDIAGRSTGPVAGIVQPLDVLGNDCLEQFLVKIWEFFILVRPKLWPLSPSPSGGGPLNSDASVAAARAQDAEEIVRSGLELKHVAGADKQVRYIADRKAAVKTSARSASPWGVPITSSSSAQTNGD